MADTDAQSESILDIIQGIDAKQLMLPEFQRDFRWEIENTYALLDSLAKDIFIGAIIYGKPSFPISCREIDMRPRKGKGSAARIDVIPFDEAQIKRKVQTENFRIVLDGQQRITSLYRSLKGIDRVFLVVKPNISVSKGSSLESIMSHFGGEEGEDAVSVTMDAAYRYATE